jgi:beta-lactamase regulating signal transducer with metallopeptidase domain
MTTLEALFSWVLTTTWQASVLAVLVLTAQALLGPRLNPRWRHALWLLVIARLLLPDLPESAFSLFRLAPAAPLNLPETISEPVIAIHPSLTNFAVPPQVAVPQPNFTFLYLALLWFSGALVLLLLTWLVNHRFARHVAHAPQITDPALLDLFAAAKTELRIRRPIRLVESAQVQSPAITGLFSPTLLLPFDAREKFTPRELRFIFLHELAHLKRGDVAIQALIALLQIIHWFNPVLWYAFRRLRADREPATDALVLSRTGEADKEPYGLMLVKLLEHFNQRHALPTLVGILEDTGQFKRRFSLIARFTRGAYGWSLLGVLVLTLLAAVCLTKAKAQTPPSGNSADGAPPTHPPHNPALDQKLLALVQYPSTDKVGAGDADAVAQLLAQGADPNAKSGPAPALIWALNFGKDDAAVALIAKGADINATDGKMSAVELASFLYYCPKALDALLKKGAHLQPAGAPPRNVLAEVFSAGPAAAGKMNYLRDRAWTDADYQAWLQRQRKVIDLLAAAGVDLNGAPGTTPPLIRAIRAGHLDGARELLRLGAKLDVHDANGQTPQSTAQTWHPEFLPELQAAETKAHEADATTPSPASNQHRLAAPPAKKTADANQIEINLKLVEIDDGYYRANKDKVDAAIERADLAYFHNLRGVSLLSCPSVSTQPAQKAIIEIVREFPYPTEFDPGKRVRNQKVAVAGGGTETLTLLVPPTPREFATRDVGVSAVVTPTINDSTTLAPGKIVLLGRVTVTDFEGFVKSNMTGVGMPCFNTSESNFLEQVDNREMKGVWIPGLHAEQPPAADQHAPPYASTNPGASVKRLLLFVSASRVP